MEIRTRFAPSPTGYMHIGNLRTALFAYLLARKNTGKFILRIEDTDQDRYVPEALNIIYRTLKITELHYDEGPDVGGPYAPYIQSERKSIYEKYAKELVERGGAYYCFCSKERLDYLRLDAEKNKVPFKYDGFCKNLTKEKVEENLAQGQSYVIRQKIPADMDVSFTDLIFGEIKTNTNNLDEGVLLKSSGLPTYNFANVIDDHLMAISHVIRGVEYISSTPKFILLYQSFGWEIPIHIHLAHILKNATQKLSKRDGDASFMDLLARGYLKDAVINYIALLGWHPKDEKELFTLAELEKVFDVNGLQKSSAIFDVKKLNWMNAQYIRKMSVEDFHALCKPFYGNLPQRINLIELSLLLQKRIEVLNEIPEKIDFLEKLPDYSLDLFEKQKLKVNKEIAFSILNKTLEKIQHIPNWKEDSIKSAFVEICEKYNYSVGQVFWTIRVALSGKEFTPGGATEIAVVLGVEQTKERLLSAIAKFNK